MSEPSRRPLAVLLKLGGEWEEIVELDGLPPPPIISRAVRRTMMRFDPYPVDPSHIAFRRRDFVLTELTSSSHKWWYRYHHGRCQTPMPAFVYMERDLQHS